MKNWKVLASVVIGSLLTSVLAYAACTLKTWSSGDIPKASDLNSNFSCVNTALRGSSTTQIIDADISPSASIAISKLATPALVSKAWLSMGSVCDGSQAAGTACSAPNASVNVTSVKSNGTHGQYQICLNYTGPGVYVGISQAHTASVFCNTTTYQPTCPQMIVKCLNNSATPTDSDFDVLVYNL